MSNDTPPNQDEKNKDEQQEEKHNVAQEDIQEVAETELEKNLEQLTEEELLHKAKEYKALSQRLAADYQNLQKETDKRLADFRKYANDQLLLEIAPLIDYFDSAFAAVPDEEKDTNWMLGIKYIQDHLLAVLKNHNVEMIEAVGQQFDPALHEAVSEEEVADVASGTILKQSQAGIKLNGKVVKHAKVVVRT